MKLIMTALQDSPQFVMDIAPFFPDFSDSNNQYLIRGINA